MAKPRLVDSPVGKQLLAALDYDPATGIFTWRYRPDRTVQWNGKWAGKPAGSVDTSRSSSGISIRISRRHYKAHRIAWRIIYGKWPLEDIDHINGDPHDNRIENLRLATRTQNSGNMRLARHNTSGFKGVTWAKKPERWQAQIKCHGNHYFLGHFDTPEEAHAAYCQAALRLYGEFARYK